MKSKMWDVMNDLEMVTSKIVSAREIIDTAAEAIQKNEYDKAETLAMAAYEFLGYYLEEFDEKFKLAWQETVVKQKKEEEDACMTPWGHSDLEYASKHKQSLTCDKDDPNPECKSAWNSFWEENYYPEEYKSNPGKIKKWVLPVEEVKDADTDNIEYFVSFPQDLLEAAKLKEGDVVEWVDNSDGTYTIRHKTMSNAVKKDALTDLKDSYAKEMIAAGYEMIDGRWRHPELNSDEC